MLVDGFNELPLSIFIPSCVPPVDRVSLIDDNMDVALLGTGLQNLAFELLHEICFQAAFSATGTNRLRLDILCKLRLVCKQMDYAAQPLIFARLHFNAGKLNTRLQRFRSQLEMTSGGTTQGCRLARRLVINYGDIFSRHSPSSSVQHLKSGTEEFIEKVLFEKLSSSISHSTRWILGHYEPTWTIPRVFEGLKLLPSLQHLTLDISRISESYFPLSSLSNMRSIRLSWKYYGTPFRVLEELTKLIQQSPNLTDLEVTAIHKTKFSLGSLLHGVMRPLRLQTLKVYGLYVSPVDFQICLPHLRELKSFELCKNTYIAPGGRETYIPPNFEIWRLMLQEQVYLDDISTDVVDDEALLEYLQVCPGIRSISLNPNMGTWASKEAAEVFYRDIIPKQPMLEELSLLPAAAGPWCYDTDHEKVLQKCRRLRRLEVMVEIPDIHEVDASESRHTIEHLLKLAGTLPHLQDLVIWPCMPASRGIVCPLGYMKHQEIMEKRIIYTILSFEIDNPQAYRYRINTCRQLFGVDGRRFALVSDS
ncbi:hypothetical protein BDQ17DRAFT_1344658 [Cyathus striatus]|nr:hypothetical protein BDQ17DRAFT_1344658 [Cyathus striatus]